jgi:hypothetical protein
MGNTARDETPDAHADLRAQVSRPLKGFTAARPSSAPDAKIFSYRPNKERFPVPELVLFLFRDVLGWTYFGPWEKVRWTVIGAIDGQPIAFELRTFGFTISRPPDRPDLDQRIEGQLITALKCVERHLAPVARGQVADGQVLVVIQPGLAITGHAHACNEVHGQFAISSLPTAKEGTLTLQFTQLCDDITVPLNGTVQLQIP